MRSEEILQSQKSWNHHAEFLRAVRVAEDGPRDPRLVPVPRATAGSDENSAANDPFGAFLLPRQFFTGPVPANAPSDPTAALVFGIPIELPEVEVPSRIDSDHATSGTAGGVTMVRTTETSSPATSRLELEGLRLEGKLLAGTSFATDKLIRYTPRAFALVLQTAFSDALGSKLLDEKLNGIGASGEMVGVLQSPCLITVAPEAAQSAATIRGINLMKMAARCWRYEEAIWLLNNECFSAFADVETPNGAPVYSPAADDAAPMGRILGRPVFMSEFCQALGVAGDVVLGRWQDYVVASTTGELEASIEVRFLARETAFRFDLYVDGGPMWRAPLTPKNGTATLSPFVTLGARP